MCDIKGCVEEGNIVEQYDDRLEKFICLCKKCWRRYGDNDELIRVKIKR